MGNHNANHLIGVKGVLSDAGGIMFDDSKIGQEIFEFLGYLRRTHPEHTQKIGGRLVGIVPLISQEVQTREGYDSVRANHDILKGMKLEEYCPLYDQWRQSYKRPNIELNPGVRTTVEKMAAHGIKFIITTDSSLPARVLEQRLKTMGLEVGRGVEGIVSSKDLGINKTSSCFFASALGRYGLEVQEAVFIGHKFEELESAHQLGLRTISLNPDAYTERMTPYAIRVANYSDILDILEVNGNGKRH